MKVFAGTGSCDTKSHHKVRARSEFKGHSVLRPSAPGSPCGFEGVLKSCWGPYGRTSIILLLWHIPVSLFKTLFASSPLVSKLCAPRLPPLPSPRGPSFPLTRPPQIYPDSPADRTNATPSQTFCNNFALQLSCHQDLRNSSSAQHCQALSVCLTYG